MRRVIDNRVWQRGLIAGIVSGVALILLVSLASNAHARAPESVRPAQRSQDYTAKPGEAFPVFEYRLHSVGQVWFTLTNFGLFGIGGSSNPLPAKDRDLLGIDYSPGFQFPAGTRNEYMYAGSLWLGGIIGTDTLVTVQMLENSAEIAEWNAYDTVQESSSLRTSQYYHPAAVAHQQYLAVVSDTFVTQYVDQVDARLHRP